MAQCLFKMTIISMMMPVSYRVVCLYFLLCISLVTQGQRQRISINDGWKFMRYTGEPDKLQYDIRPEVTDRNDNVVADSKPTEAVTIRAEENVLKKWILPTANDFIKDPTKHHQRPGGNPGFDFPFVQARFNDAAWELVNLPHDWAMIFPDWYEPDIRAFIQRDRNHPSIMAWSFGNEVGEQYTDTAGATLAKKLRDIVREEDSTRPATASMNYAKPDMPFPDVMDMLCLNYQGEGIRDAPAYAHLKGIRTSPLYPAFHAKFPNKLIVSSETASTLSSRGTYVFPVTDGISAPVSDSTGGDPKNKYVSAYELYTAAFGASPDKVFASQDKHPYVAGEFVWSGWDYLGEPTPYYSAHSSYSGIIDLAGFKKDRFYLYQARWRPDLPMAHILPHWTWPDRMGMITPVHVFSSGDEAELFLNDRSLGRKKKALYEYRFRWDSVQYAPGVLRVVTYKNGKQWAADTVTTAGTAAKLQLIADRNVIKANGNDLSFITLQVTDNHGTLAPEADNKITFDISGPGEIIATDNGDAADLVSFASKERKAFKGLALVIVRAKTGTPGIITITTTSKGLATAQVVIKSQ
jgi:beta-galactosidase